MINLIIMVILLIIVNIAMFATGYYVGAIVSGYEIEDDDILNDDFMDWDY